MARTIVFLCDACLDRDGSEVPGVEVTVMVPGVAGPRVIALCESDTKEMLYPLAELVASRGLGERETVPTIRDRAPRAAAEANPALKCPDPDCPTGYQGKTRGGLRQHVQRVHGKSITDYPGYEDQVPRTGGPEPYGPQKPIREWLRSQGVEPPQRGRLPGDLVAQWEAAGRPGAA